MILILSGEKDAHYQYVKEKLKKLNADFVLFDFSQYPMYALINFEMDKISVEFKDGKIIHSNQIKTVWNRRKGKALPSQCIHNENVKEYITRESQFLLDSFPQILPAFWISQPDAISVAARKPYQLLVAKELGFTIPPTYIGNSVKEANKFINEFKNIAIKTLCMPSIIFQERKDNNSDTLILYTKRIKTIHFKEVLNQIRNCPIIIQPYIEKEFELRITVVGKKVFSCAIFSQSTERTQEDWRRYDILKTPHKVYELPKEIESKCLKLVKKLGLAFGCIDMIVTPNGEYIFLEINPNGQWLWIERLTGLPIADTLSKILVAGRII